MSDTQVRNGLSSSLNLRKPARKSNILKGLLAVLFGVVLFSTVAPSAAHAASARVQIDRINGSYVVQGWGFAPNTRGTVSASLGTISGQKTTAINSTGYFWLTFTTFTSNYTGSSTAKASDPKGGYAQSTTTMGSGNTASVVNGKTVEFSSPTAAASTTPIVNAPNTTPTTAAPSTPAGWNLAFDDEFNGTSVDQSKWGLYNGTGNEGIGTRSSSAVSEKNGELDMTGHNWVGGGMGSNFKATYGKLEMRMKFDKGSGYNVATLLWPSSEHWPVDGELDLGEMFDGDTTKLGTFDHWGSNNTQTGHSTQGDFSQWHTVDVDWEPTGVTWSIDGQQVMQVTGAGDPSTSHFIGIQLDVSKNNTKTNGETLHVDYVRFYKHA